MSHCDGFADVCARTEPVARRDHACSACGETIASGQKYTRWGVVYDGTAETVKQCSRCRAIFEAIVDEHPQEPIDLCLGCGETWEDVIGPCPDEVAALAFMLPGEAAP